MPGAERGVPGAIAQRVLDGLKAVMRQAPDEPIEVLAFDGSVNSLFDAVTVFMDDDPDLKEVHIAHWISFGSQVSFFAELGQFPGASSPTPGHPSFVETRARRRVDELS